MRSFQLQNYFGNLELFVCLIFSVSKEEILLFIFTADGSPPGGHPKTQKDIAKILGINKSRLYEIQQHYF